MSLDKSKTAPIIAAIQKHLDYEIDDAESLGAYVSGLDIVASKLATAFNEKPTIRYLSLPNILNQIARTSDDNALRFKIQKCAEKVERLIALYSDVEYDPKSERRAVNEAKQLSQSVLSELTVIMETLD